MFARLAITTHCTAADAIALFEKLAKIIKPELIETGGDIEIEIRGLSESVQMPEGTYPYETPKLSE
jgi:hypothetical protein